MKPVSSNIKTNNKCLNPVTTKCVTWDGPEITCLDGTVLCKGQSIEVTLYAIATKLCQVINELNLEGINPCINNIQDSTSVNINQNSTLQEVFSAIIQKVCSLTDRVVTLENEECPVLFVTVPVGSCFRDVNYPNWNVENQPTWNDANDTIPATVFAELVAVAVCSMLIDITALQNNVNSINQQIADLWTALQNCVSSCDNLVLPTCTYDYTLNPDGEPVSIQTAYTWLEADYCTLKSALGTPEQIVEAVQKQCPDLTFLERLSSGGQMGDIAGWNSNPTTLAESLGNLWLTVCDMRQAVSTILNGCCFTPCSYFEFGYDLIWDPNGAFVDVVFNGSGPHFIYTDLSVPPAGTSPFNAIPGGPLPAWLTTQFPTASQTNIIITLSDGSVSATYDTGQGINDWAIESNPTNNGYRITFAAIPGYDVNSLDQTINFSFTYTVDDGTTVTPCEIDQTDGFEYECCAPVPYTCDAQLVMSVDPNGIGFTCVINGTIFESAQLVDSAVSGPGTGSNTLSDTSGIDFNTLSIGTGASGGSIVYINYNSVTNTYDQCRYVTAINIAGNELTVDSNWSPAITNTDTYVVKDNFYDNPGTSLNPCVDSLLNFTVKVIEVNTGFDKTDPNTWNVVYQKPTISWATISNTPGFQIPNGYIDPNKEYVIAVYANYPCGQSEPSFVGELSPILASVSIQVGTLTSPVTQAFSSSSLTSSVVSIISNDVVPNLPNETATSTTPALFGLDLPVNLNLTQFLVKPAIPSWAFVAGLTPQSFCSCGLNLPDPFGTITLGTQTLPTRNAVLGLYRGYDVRIYKNDIVNNTTTPILDNSAPPIPYVTNSLVDPNINFINNTPTVSGGGILVGVPPTYAESTLPIVIQYDPNPYAVNTGVDYHKVWIRNDVPSPIQIVFNNNGGVPVNYQAWIDILAFRWDDATSQYINYSPIRSSTVTTGVVTVPAASTSGFVVIPTINPFILCKYGDALYAQVRFTDNILAPTPRQVIYNLSLRSATVPTLTTQNYSCSGIVQTAQRLTAQTLPNTISPASPPNAATGVSVSTLNQFFIPMQALITEDFEFNVILNYTTN